MTSAFSSSQITSPYQKYVNFSRYVFRSNDLTLPVAYATGTAQQQYSPAYTQPFEQRQAAEVVNTAAMNAFRIVIFDMVRVGAPPQIPSPLPSNDNEVFDDADISIHAPVIAPDGENYLYAARGWIRFKQLQPQWPTTDQLRIGSTPASTDTADGNLTDFSWFDTDLR